MKPRAPIFFKGLTMSLETGSEAPASEAVTETVSSPEVTAVESSSSGSGYSAVDPGYEAGDDFEPENENTETPSETLDDASGEEQTTEETVETPAVVEAAETEVISDELLDKAFDLGYTIDDLKKFTDVKSLELEITRTAQLKDRWNHHQAAKNAEPAPKKPEDILVGEETPEPNWEELVELGHDPDIVALNKRSWQEAQDAKAMVRQLLKNEQQRAFTAQCERFDNTLNAIGDEFKDVFGTGTVGDLMQKSPEQAQNRQAVFDKMNMLRHGYLTAGQKVPAEADLIQEAVHATFYKHAQKTARNRLKGDIQRASSQALSRPNSGGAKPLSGQSLALQLEQQFWRERKL